MSLTFVELRVEDLLGADISTPAGAKINLPEPGSAPDTHAKDL